MAAQEIAKHTKKFVRVLSNREHGWAHKLREMALEIFTIVFAVTLSIWLHGLSEHSHQQKEVKTFLLGLKADLTSDIEQLNEIKTSYKSFDANYAYLAGLAPADRPGEQRFEAAWALAQSNIFFMSITSRYEGFKSSGKLGNIEDEKLLGIGRRRSSRPSTRRTRTRPAVDGSAGAQKPIRPLPGIGRGRMSATLTWSRPAATA